MSQTRPALHVVPAATVTHTIVTIRGDVLSDITVHHARTGDARISLVSGTALMTLYSASATHGLLEAFATARGAGVPLAWKITRRPTSTAWSANRS